MLPALKVTPALKAVPTLKLVPALKLVLRLLQRSRGPSVSCAAVRQPPPPRWWWHWRARTMQQSSEGEASLHRPH